MDSKRTGSFIEGVWDKSIVPKLCDYIKIPNLSPMFDPSWERAGHMDRAVELIADWCKGQGIKGLTLEVIREKGRTPLIFMDVPGDAGDTVMLYGHLDKQPPMTGWSEGLGPFTPVIRDGRLYGRGGADDGYAAFCAVTALKALQEQGVRRARCVILIEACEESGSDDLPYYVDALAARIGTPSLVVCLDSGCGDYERLWCTTSLRGLVIGKLQVELLHEGVHSGEGSGVVASSFRVARSLLSRLEDEQTGEIRPREFHAEISAQRRKQTAAVTSVLGQDLVDKLPLHPGVKPVTSDLTELQLNRTWRPALSITGQDGIPPYQSGGNVLRPLTALKLSLRLPPSVDADAASARLKQLLEKDPPYGAKVTFEPESPGSGWAAPDLAPWLEQSVDSASERYFGKSACYMGEGGSIPFMGMLGLKFPKAQFLVTGVLGPQSNAHGPNEFLDIPTGKRLTSCVAQVLADHAAQLKGR
jgi:acetylornithine deacetylase/succinyl-diaminopimelate desuccinylase-like protein